VQFVENTSFCTKPYDTIAGDLEAERNLEKSRLRLQTYRLGQDADGAGKISQKLPVCLDRNLFRRSDAELFPLIVADP
jgi:hypothetical protein